MSKQPRRGWLPGIGLAVSGPTLAAAFLFLCLLADFDSPPFALERLDRLTTDMTTEDVRATLGSPSSTWERTTGDGGDHGEWACSQTLSWPIVCFLRLL